VKTGGAALVLLAALACKPAAPPPQDAAAPPPATSKQPTGPDDPNERANLLNFAHGATVVSRSGEWSLSLSALNAIDGELTSAWVMNAGDYPQSVTIALAARSRIERVGIATNRTPPVAIDSLTFESSLDGTTFTPLAQMKPQRSDKAQLMSVTPVDATFIRATLTGGGRSGRANAVFALGRELAAPKAPSIAGCWTINGVNAILDQQGAHANGRVDTTPTPTYLDGGFDGRFFRFTWSRGASFGYEAISVSPDGAHLSGQQWHEEPIPLFFAESWFGDRRDCTSTIIDQGKVTRELLRRNGRAPLFGLAFDANGNLNERESLDTLTTLHHFLVGTTIQARLVAHEFRAATPAKNLALANAQLTSLEQWLLRNGVPQGRVSFVAAGSDTPREVPVTDAMRALYSSVDLEIRR